MADTTDALRALRDGDALDFSWNDRPKCPHCGSDYDIEDNDAHRLYEEGEYTVECSACERQFAVRTTVTYTFSTDEQGGATMAQMTESLARAILNGDGCTRHELEQLCRHFLATPASPATINHDGIDRKLIDGATPAGSASGEVQRYFRGEYGMVAAGPEYPHRDGDTYWVAEQDYAALQAEVARAREMNRALADDLCAAESEAARLRKQWPLWRNRWVSDRTSRICEVDCVSYEMARAQAESEAIDYEEQFNAALHQRKENGHAG